MTSKITEFWRDKVYAAALKEDIPLGFQSHVFIMRVTGIWPMADDSAWYTRYTVVIFLLIGLLLPLEESVNIFFAMDSVEGAMDHVYLSLTHFITAVKAFIIYWYRDDIREIFRLHAILLRGNDVTTDRYKRTVRMNYLVHISFTSIYVISWWGALVQVLTSEPDEAMWRSTLHFPFKLADNHALYLIVLVYQGLSILANVFWTAVTDAFYVALINMICYHVTYLKKRLVRLGAQPNDRLFYKDLIECCERHESCLRWVHVALTLH